MKMALTLQTNLRDALANQIDTTIGTTGFLKFETSGDAEVATLPFSNPAFGPSSAGVISVSGTPSDASATGGIIAQFSIYDGTTAPDTKLLEGTCGTVSSGEDIEITSLTIAATEQVDLTSLTITVPAS
jgi:hypothetical protein